MYTIWPGTFLKWRSANVLADWHAANRSRHPLGRGGFVDVIELSLVQAHVGVLAPAHPIVVCSHLATQGLVIPHWVCLFIELKDGASSRLHQCPA
jgi:hypothetical protein